MPYGHDMPEGLHYPTYVKPVKTACSVLARQVDSRDELQAHTRFGRRELWMIRRLVEPFERVARQRLSGAGSAHRLRLETPLPASTPQYNLEEPEVFAGGCGPPEAQRIEAAFAATAATFTGGRQALERTLEAVRLCTAWQAQQSSGLSD